MDLREKWEDFMFWLEDHNIPKPAFFALIIAIIVVIFILLGGLELIIPAPREEVTLNVIVLDRKENPIEGASVTIKSEELTKVEETNENGIATFLVYKDSEVIIEVSYEGETARETITVEGFTEKRIMLDIELITYADKKIVFFKEGTDEKYTDIESIDAACSNTDWHQSNSQVINGEVLLRRVPSNCGKLSIKVNGEWHEVSAEGTEPVRIYLKEEVKKGRLIVKVVDSEGVPIGANAVEVRIKNSVGQYVGSQKTNASDTVVFDELLPDRYEITASGEHYKPSTSSAEVKGGKDTVKTMYVEPLVTGFPIKIRVVDTKGFGVKNVELQLRDSETQQILVNKQFTDAKGEYVFNVPEEKEYLIILALPNGWKKQIKAVPKEEFYEVTYDEEELEEGGTVVIEVKDQENEPLESATVELYTMEHNTSGYACATGADGFCEIEHVEPGRYYAQVKLYSYSPAISEDFEVLPGETTTVGPVTLEVDKGVFEFTVLNENSEPIAGAKIDAYDIDGERLIKSGSTNGEGIATLSIRTNVLPYFVIYAKGYLPYITAPIAPVANLTIEKKVVLQKEFSGIKVEFKGLEYEGEMIEDSVSPGTEYKGTFLLIVGKSGYSKAGLHIRTGSDTIGKVNKVESDNGYIKQIIVYATKLVKGSTYTPLKGEATDLKSIAKEESKWANIEWNLSDKLKKGVFEVEAAIVVRDSAITGDIFKLSYRGYAVSTAYDRDPSDEVLGSQKSTAEKDSLYAKTYDIVYSIGVSNLCDDSFCQSYFIEDLQKKTRLAIIDTYSARIGNRYKLHFTINNKTLELSEAEMKLKNEQRGLQFGAYKVYGTGGKEVTGNIDSSSGTISIGTFTSKSTIAGEVEFETIKDGTQVITIELQNGAETVLEKEITIEIPEGKEMMLEVVPKNIVAMIDNELLFKVSDKESEEAIQDASITLTLDDKHLTTGTTNSEGVFAFTLEAPSAGSKLKVRAMKPGYRPISRTIEISEEVFNITPPEVKIELSPIGGESLSFSFDVENISAIPIEIEKIEFENDELGEYITIEGFEDAKGEIIEPGKAITVELSATLTNKGKRVEEITQLESAFTVTVTNKTLEKSWVKSANLSARIMLEGALESTDCLVVEPAKWEINTTTKAKQLAVTIKNMCAVGTQPAPLRNIEMRVYWGASDELGKFSVTSSELEIENEELGKTYIELAPYVEPEFEDEIIVTFVPDEEVESGEANAKIQIRAKHVSSSGKEEVKTAIDVSLTVNNIAECVKVIKREPLELRTCGYDTGWGNSMRYFDRDPYASSTQPAGYQSPQPTTYMQPWQMPWQPTWPSTQVQQPWQTTYSQGPYNTQWQCESEKAEIRVENNCTTDVIVSFDAASALTLEPEELEIASGEISSFEVSPTARMGKYDIVVRAKPKGSKEKWKKIDKLYFTVMRFDDVSEKCYPIIEPTTLRTNFLGWQKAAGKIYNKCYNFGYRLEQITKENFHCMDPETGGMQIAQGVCPLIREVFVSPPTVQKVSDTETWEVMEFSIWYDPNITQRWPLLLEGPIDKRIGMIRAASSSLYSAVISPGEIYVPMYIPFLGQKKYFKVQVTFEDPFEWFGVAGTLIDAGDPNKQPSECVNKEALNVPAAGEEYLYIGDDHFANDIFTWKENPPKSEWVMPVATSNEQIIGVPGVEQASGFCGRSDYIEKLPYTTWTDAASGIKITFELTHNKHHIVMKVDRSEMFTKCALIDFQYPIKVTRVFNNPGTEEVLLHVAVNVLNKGVTEYYEGCEFEEMEKKPVPGWANLESCDTTGEAIYSQYGFDKLLFTWEADEITQNTCRTKELGGQGYFCDGAQFLLSISGDLVKIKNKIEELNNRMKEDQSLVLTAKAIHENSELESELMEPGKMYKIMKKQTIVNDSVQNKNLLVFLQSQSYGGGMLPAPSLSADSCDLSELESDLSGLVENLSTETEEFTTLRLLGFRRRFEAKLRECYGSDITTENVIGIIAPEMDYAVSGTEASEAWGVLSAPAIGEMPIIEHNDSVNAYVITFEEYMAIHNQILQGILSNIRSGQRDSPIVVNIGGLSMQSNEAVWLSFLQMLKENIEFKLVVINKPGMSPALEEYVKEYAENAVQAESNETPEDIIFSANIKTDNLSPQFVSDFLAAYPKIPINPDQIEFKQYMHLENSLFSEETNSKRVSSGQYAYRIEPKIMFDFSNSIATVALDKFIVKLYQEKSLEGIDSEKGTSYAENPLMYLSFDAPLGRGSSSADYGIAFSPLPEKKLYYNWTDEASSMAEIAERSPGIRTITMEFSDKFEKTREGKVIELDLSKNKLKYYPSYPVSLKVSSSSGQNNILFYRFNIPSYYGNVNALFAWFSLNTDQVQTPVDEFKTFEPAAFCEGWTEPSEMAKLFLPPGDWYSITFVPYATTGETLQLELSCAMQPAVMQAKVFEGSETQTELTTGLPGGSVKLNEPGNPPSIKEYLERIKNGEICVDTISKKELLLRWNPNAVELPG